ncbi:MAG: hypothetical protein V4664_04270, partial [Patescibacteria group bacterium]
MNKIVTFLFALVFSTAAANAITILTFGGTGYITQNREYVLTTKLPEYTVNVNNNVTEYVRKKHVEFTFIGKATYWSLSIAAPNGEDLKVGTYANVARYGFQDINQAGLDLSGDGRGHNTLTGSVKIKAVEWDSNGKLIKFEADFQQF